VKIIRDGDLRIDLDLVRRLVLERFPMVSVRTFYCPDDHVPLMDVFCIPDDRMREFWEFSGEEYSRWIDAQGLQWIGLLPHSESETREHYPGVCTHIDSGDADATAARRS
jgi:hypothetical protein